MKHGSIVMAYRRTPRMQERIDATRAQIADAARRLVAASGYAGTGIPDIARAAGISTGSIYRHFPSKAALFQEVFQKASRHEIAAFAQAAQVPGTAPERLAGMVETFARRALRGRTLARALLVEPVGPELDADRRRFRAPYQALIEEVLSEGIAAGELVGQDPRITSICIVGAIVETLLGPLSEPSGCEQGSEEEEALVRALVATCLRAAAPLSPAPRSA